MQRCSARDLAYITDGIFMSRRIPVDCFPCCRGQVFVRGTHKNCNMFRIERMPMTSAIFSPQMVIVDFRDRGTIDRAFCGEYLSVDCSVVSHDLWFLHVGLKFGRAD